MEMRGLGTGGEKISSTDALDAMEGYAIWRKSGRVEVTRGGIRKSEFGPRGNQPTDQCFNRLPEQQQRQDSAGRAPNPRGAGL